MKTKIFTIFLLLAGTTVVLGRDFSLSTGAGGVVGGFFTRYSIAADGVVEGERLKIKATQKMNQFDYGFFGFIDATYAVFSVSFQDGRSTYKEKADVSVFGDNVDMTGKGWDSVIGLSLLGKYPFQLNEKFTISPLFGAEYQISTKQRRTQADGWIYDRTDGLRERDKNGNAFSLSDWNALKFNFGVGLDYNFMDDLFFRGEFLYAIRWITPYESKNLDLIKSQTNDKNPKLRGLASGPSLRLSMGYRFYTRAGDEN